MYGSKAAQRKGSVFDVWRAWRRCVGALRGGGGTIIEVMAPQKDGGTEGGIMAREFWQCESDGGTSLFTCGGGWDSQVSDV